MTKRIIKFGSSLLERQTLRCMCFALGAMSILWSLQLSVTYFLTGYSSWIQQSITYPPLAMIIMFIPLVLGIALIIGKIKRSEKLIVHSLLSLWVYNFFMCILNAVIYLFQGTPMLLHLTVGLFALILHVYYVQRDDDIKQDETIILNM